MVFNILLVTSLVGSGLRKPGMIPNCADSLQGNHPPPSVQILLIFAQTSATICAEAFTVLDHHSEQHRSMIATVVPVDATVISERPVKGPLAVFLDPTVAV
jgi:hypothetical protein